MPAFYTHRYFAKQVYQDFKPTLKKKINYEYYLFFAQSFDILYYNYGSKKYLNKLGHLAHRQKTKAFFQNILELMDESTEIDTEVNVNDKFLTLSTCYKNSSKRLVVQAKLIKKQKNDINY